MLQKKPTICSWGAGLSNKQSALLYEYLSDKHYLVLHSLEEMMAMLDSGKENPCLLWLSSQLGQDIHKLPLNERRRFEQVYKAILLDEAYSLADFENSCELGITEIVRPPYSKERIVEIMRRASEMHSVQHDLHCMTREILLERELWERKNELLSFLVNFFTDTTESLDLKDIMQTAYLGLSRLLPLHSMHLTLWEQEGNDTAHLVSLYINSSPHSREYAFWRDILLGQTQLALGPNFSLVEIEKLELDKQNKGRSESDTNDTTLLSLPIIFAQEQLGILFLLTSIERHLGRDQALALDSAMRHFALNIKNARRFQRIQMYADYDILTKVHNRRHFENRIEELTHVRRYAQPLSLLMLDIDHFKQINDSRGHQTGDIILRKVASLVTCSIRTTDYCARYGGEEFVILMPHTDSKEALYFAERMRQTIADYSFVVGNGDPLKLTVSLGIASLEPNSPKNKQQLLKEADTALYAAKADGRNCTRENAA